MTHAVLPPMMIDKKERRVQFVNNNGEGEREGGEEKEKREREREREIQDRTVSLLFSLVRSID